MPVYVLDNEAEADPNHDTTYDIPWIFVVAFRQTIEGLIESHAIPHGPAVDALRRWHPSVMNHLVE
jgi:hypothetical protein